jgi:hypothetical protein
VPCSTRTGVRYTWPRPGSALVWTRNALQEDARLQRGKFGRRPSNCDQESASTPGKRVAVSDGHGACAARPTGIADAPSRWLPPGAHVVADVDNASTTASETAGPSGPIIFAYDYADAVARVDNTSQALAREIGSYKRAPDEGAEILH